MSNKIEINSSKSRISSHDKVEKPKGEYPIFLFLTVIFVQRHMSIKAAYKIVAASI